MLPILPALILLLLHGPSNMERLAREGRLPAALEAIHREMDRPEAVRSRASEAVLASLLATRDPQLSTALFALLRPEAPEPAPPVVDLTERPAKQILDTGTTPVPSEGFGECRRTRDGPVAIA